MTRQQRRAEQRAAGMKPAVPRPHDPFVPVPPEKQQFAPWFVTCAWTNDFYAVMMGEHQTEWGEVQHIMVRRADGQPIRSWADMQWIKNQFAGTGVTAVELYPTEEEVVDAANMYHLWVLPAGFQFPFGLHLKTMVRPAHVTGKEDDPSE